MKRKYPAFWRLHIEKYINELDIEHVTPWEYGKLLKYVSRGYSPYSNFFNMVDSSGNELDYICALKKIRKIKSIRQFYNVWVEQKRLKKYVKNRKFN